MHLALEVSSDSRLSPTLACLCLDSAQAALRSMARALNTLDIRPRRPLNLEIYLDAAPPLEFQALWGEEAAAEGCVDF